MEKIHIKTPGRVCLYGDHQDYLGLPVIACAIDRYIELQAHPIDEPELRIDLPDLGMERIIDLRQSTLKVEPNDHLASGLKVIQDLRLETDQGYKVTISGNLPINAGVSSSSAVMVAWMHFLSQAYDLTVDAEQLGQLAYQAEVVEHNSPGGNMDQLTIACGGVVHIDTQGQGKVKSLMAPKMGLVLGVSGLPKTTLGTLGSNRQKAELAVQQVKVSSPAFDLHLCSPDEIHGYKNLIDTDNYAAFEAAIGNHAITQAALTELHQESADLEKLGSLMTRHHELLRDKLQLSTPLIEDMLNAAYKKGALGGKIVGSGGGGCVICLCYPGQEKAIAESMMTAGAKDAFKVNVSAGSQKL